MNHSNSTNVTCPLQVRRLACDRCRAQKLKCVREESSAVCQRCTSAKTKCIFGTPHPSGRPSTVGSSATSDTIGHSSLSSHSSSGSNGSHGSNSSSGSNGNAMIGMRNFQQPSGMASSSFGSENLPNPAGGHDFSRPRKNSTTNSSRADSPIRSRNQMQNFEEESSFNLFSSPYTMEIDTSAFGESPMVKFECVGSPPQQSPDHPNNAGASHLHFMTNTDPSDIGMRMNLENVPATTFPNGILQNSVSENAEQKFFSDLEGLSSSELISPGLSALLSPLENGGSPHSQRMQQVTQLTTLMYELQSIYSHDDNNLRPFPTGTFPAEFAGQVLQAAAAFLKSLRLFLADETPPPSFSGYYSSPSSSDSLPSRRSYSTDRPATLQIIACYIRLLQLYVLLYTAIHDYVRSTAPQFRQPIWTDLSVGGTPLNAFGDSQIKLVLQVAAHLLHETEAALGLPECCRLSTVTASEGVGILRMNVTTHFIEMCMAEATDGSGDGRGTIPKLRDTMNNLSELLSGPVWF